MRSEPTRVPELEFDPCGERVATPEQQVGRGRLLVGGVVGNRVGILLTFPTEFLVLESGPDKMRKTL